MENFKDIYPRKFVVNYYKDNKEQTKENLICSTKKEVLNLIEETKFFENLCHESNLKIIEK